MTAWQPVIGFEVHIELSTNSKMFCGCPADHFGQPPNTQTCPVCLGLPGALPVPSVKAIEWCIKLGLALGCQVNLVSKFDRKNYFYPDLPKGYQISQYDLPFCHDGELLGHKITRVHLEEDTGKLLHQSDKTLIDFNRSGVPLVEVVTEPDFNNSQDTDAFLKELQSIVRVLKISTADMEKGSMRLEANISIRPANTKDLPGYKIEVKNVNSFRFIKKAIEFEITRQSRLLKSGVNPVQETRGFNEAKSETFSQRGKEEAHDYRYFPEPDIPPLQFTTQQIEKWRSQLPLLPAQVRSELITRYHLSPQYAQIIASDQKMYADFQKDPTLAHANSLVNKRPPEISELLSDPQKIKEIAQKIVSTNPKAVADIKAGKTQVMGFLLGQVKKQLSNIDVPLTRKIISDIIG